MSEEHETPPGEPRKAPPSVHLSQITTYTFAGPFPEPCRRTEPETEEERRVRLAELTRTVTIIYSKDGRPIRR